MKMGINILLLTLAMFMLITASSCTSLHGDKSDSLICEATTLFDNNQKEDAIKLYRKALKEGNIRAQPFLATCFMYGDGAEKNEAKAHSLYKTFSASGTQPSDFLFIEMHIKVSSNDVVNIEGIVFKKENQSLDKVSELISGLAEIANQQNSPFVVNIELQAQVSHRRILSVLNACSNAGVEFPFFFRIGLPPRPKIHVDRMPRSNVKKTKISATPERVRYWTKEPNQILDPTWTTPVLKATSDSQAGQD